MTRFLTSLVFLFVAITSTHRVDADMLSNANAINAVSSAVTTVVNSDVAKEVVTDATNAAKQAIGRLSSTSPTDVANKVASAVSKAGTVYHKTKNAYSKAKYVYNTAGKMINTAKSIASEVSSKMKQTGVSSGASTSGAVVNLRGAV
jgi:hypothetical protein